MEADLAHSVSILCGGRGATLGLLADRLLFGVASGFLLRLDFRLALGARHMGVGVRAGFEAH